MLADQSFGTYACDSKSKIFIDYYNNKFPDLIFYNENIGEEFILTKKELFFYNNYNKSDTNLYFMIYFSTVYISKWMLGRPFLEKFRLSFDLGNSEILYHKKKISNEEEERNKIINGGDNENTNFSTALKVILIIVLVLIIFFLGFLFHRLITRMPRKKKANELEDGFDYTEKNEKLNKNNVGINNDE